MLGCITELKRKKKGKIQKKRIVYGMGSQLNIKRPVCCVSGKGVARVWVAVRVGMSGSFVIKHSVDDPLSRQHVPACAAL